MSSFFRKGIFKNCYGSLEITIVPPAGHLLEELGVIPITEELKTRLTAHGWRREYLEHAAQNGFAFSLIKDCLFKLEG